MFKKRCWRSLPKISIFLSILAFSIFPNPALHASSSVSKAKIVYLKNSVEVYFHREKKWVYANKFMRLQAGDKIRTGKQGSAMLKLNRKKTVLVSENTVLVLRKLQLPRQQRRTSTLFSKNKIGRNYERWDVEQGTVLFQMPKKPRENGKKEGHFIEVMTPAVRIKSKNSGFALSVTKTGSTIFPLDGNVLLWNPKKRPAKIYTIPKGEYYFVKNESGSGT